MIKDFIFEGRRASDYGLVPCYIDGNSGIDRDNVVSKTSFKNFTPASSDEDMFIGSTDDYRLSKDLDFCIYDCKSGDIKVLTKSDIEEYARWLCRSDGYHPMQITFSNDEVYIYNAKIDITAIEINTDIIGFSMHIDTDSSYAYTQKTVSKTLSSPTDSINIVDYSSKVGRTFIDMEITCLEAGDYEITNDFGCGTIKILDCAKNETITITEHQVITSSNSAHDISDDFNYVFPYIRNDMSRNSNTFYFNKPCKVKITYKCKRKVGI